jgi:ribosome modulation factor
VLGFFKTKGQRERWLKGYRTKVSDVRVHPWDGNPVGF